MRRCLNLKFRNFIKLEVISASKLSHTMLILSRLQGVMTTFWVGGDDGGNSEDNTQICTDFASEHHPIEIDEHQGAKAVLPVPLVSCQFQMGSAEKI